MQITTPTWQLRPISELAALAPLAAMAHKNFINVPNATAKRKVLEPHESTSAEKLEGTKMATDGDMFLWQIVYTSRLHMRA